MLSLQLKISAHIKVAKVIENCKSALKFTEEEGKNSLSPIRSDHNELLLQFQVFTFAIETALSRSTRAKLLQPHTPKSLH